MRNKISCSLCRLATAWPPAQKQLFRIASLFLCVLLVFTLVPFDSFAASSTEVMIYNGYALPPPPDDNAFYVIGKGAGSTFYLYVSQSNFFYFSDKGHISNSNSSFTRFTLSSGEWVPSGSFGFTTQFVLWSSHDIYYSGTDKVYFYASDPQSVEEATLYSYNGFIAPSCLFDKWGSSYEEHYLIYRDSETNDIICAISAYSHAFSGSDENGWSSWRSLQVNPYYNAYTYKYSNGSWVKFAELPHGLSFSIPKLSNIIWSSHDVYYNYPSTNEIIYEGSEPVPLGYETDFYTILVQGDDSNVYPGESVLLQLYDPYNNYGKAIWSVSGNDSDLTTVKPNSNLTINGISGLSPSATLNISSSETADTLVIYCTYIDGNNNFTTKTLYLDIIPSPNANYTIVKMGDPFADFIAGSVFNFQVFDSNDSASTPVYAEWSIEGDNINYYTTISDTGELSLSLLQEPTSITVIASNIDHTGKTATYTVNTLPYDFAGGGGDNPSNPSTPPPDATNQDVVDSVQDGFDNLGNKLEDMGNNIVSNLLEGLLRFFVPTAEDLSSQMNEFKSWIDETIPILAVPVALVQFVYDLFFGVTPELGVMTFPQISWMDNVLIEQTNLDLSQYEWLDSILPLIRTTLTAACCFAFINWIINKVGEVSKS